MGVISPSLNTAQLSSPHLTMPDTIVPLVRRAVRRSSTTTDPKLSDVNNTIRKLSIGGESNSEQASPARLRRTWTPKESPTPERRRSLLSSREEPLQVETPTPVQVIEKTTPRAGNCFPTSKRDNLPSLPVARNRPIKTSKDLELERKVLQWIVSVVKEKPTTDYDRFIQDGTVISKLMVRIVFNSVPIEQIYTNWGINPVLDRVKSVIHEMRRYGVTELFEPKDLMEMRNIPLVTKSLAQLCKLAAADSTNLLNN